MFNKFTMKPENLIWVGTENRKGKEVTIDEAMRFCIFKMRKTPLKFIKSRKTLKSNGGGFGFGKLLFTSQNE